MKQFLTTIYVVAFATHATALGINCRGSFACPTDLITCGIADLQDQINMLDDDAQFGPGEHVACCDHLCAFTQQTDQTISGAYAKQLIAAVRNHGCTRCGSAPFSDNNVAEGELKVNFVLSQAKFRRDLLA